MEYARHEIEERRTQNRSPWSLPHEVCNYFTGVWPVKSEFVFSAFPISALLSMPLPAPRSASPPTPKGRNGCPLRLVLAPAGYAQ
jgi:hypothetical protein